MIRCYLFTGCLVLSWTVSAGTLGLDPLRAEQPGLTGAGIHVVQAEGGGQVFEVNPAAVGQPVSLFRWISAQGSATTYPNLVGTESAHANQVGSVLYGANSGWAPGVAKVDNYESLHFYNSVIAPRLPTMAQVINQSFVFNLPENVVNRAYDDFAATRNVLFICGAGNGGAVMPPATCYNGLAVAAYQGASSVGPTADGRAKPELTAPASFTSFSTPAVAGAAALLWQAGEQGDGGSPVQATNALTLKALLINGAVKPAGWTNGVNRPLDARHGAGLLDVYRSYLHLAGGKHAAVEMTSPATGGPHPPGTASENLPTLRGWDRNTISSDLLNDAVHHYYFDLPGGVRDSYSLTATLVWARHLGEVDITNLELFLYDVESGSVVVSSQSAVDNLEHVFLTGLAPGRYDLQVLKHGGVAVSATEEYALGFEFVSERLEVLQAAQTTNVVWPVSSAGFSLEGKGDLNGTWTPESAPVLVTNGLNRVEIGASGSSFFRLARP